MTLTWNQKDEMITETLRRLTVGLIGFGAARQAIHDLIAAAEQPSADRSLSGSLTILDGEAGTGKSTWANKQAKENPRVRVAISLSGALALLKGDRGYHVILDSDYLSLRVKHFDVETETIPAHVKHVWTVDGEVQA